MVTNTDAAEQHAFVLAGLPGCGKSTAAQEIVREIEQGRKETATITEVSDYVRALFKAETAGEDVNLSPELSDSGENSTEEAAESVTDDQLGRWAAEQKREYGSDYFVRGMAELWHGEHKPHTVISGVRSPAEAEVVRDVFGPEHTTVIAIWTLPDERFERKYGEPSSTDHPEWETFQERNEREIHEWGCVEFFVNVSDYIVPNNSSVAALRIDLVVIIDHEVYGDDLPDKWNNDYYPFPKRDTEVVAQYL